MRAWLPIAAAAMAVFGHLAAEAIATGQSLAAVATEPRHLYLLVLPVLLLPLWSAAIRNRRLDLVLFAFISGSLICEGSGLGAAALATAVLIGAVLSLIGARAVESAAASPVRGTFVSTPRSCRAISRRNAFAVSGPYFAYVPARGNRPPPQLP